MKPARSNRPRVSHGTRGFVFCGLGACAAGAAVRRLIVHYYSQNDRLARQVLTYALEADSLPGLPRTAPSFGQPIHIYLANTTSCFRS
jgi:hypothetical protein